MHLPGSPVARGDVETVKAHVHALAGDTRGAALYKATALVARRPCQVRRARI
jgi:predicted short-subunit dehydrogenase-like oxidoreductase (DUF2520 family)